ncbi:LysR substrate-binding domain-containing protein [Rhodococcus sp. G-MC3]|uniref:LysR substrate-binding domain-containing protein n=1 Tax=Rhodococcus sp. G-MC3 TaxID=3046209 RepID=UPI0024BADDF7|nr:LysR substrate-binding domain-containing protein [Rhodococcus sp. G-MC3]MDJ0391754.1 LysR substrate-binding domain-containing protein [Rhodococcus sp. G-MC3]
MPDQSYQPTLSQLRAFVAVAQHRHFGSAASMLNVSQPTLSQALASLEHGLGVKLVERSTRKVLMTTAGTQLLDRARSTIESADGFMADASGLGGSLSGPLRLGLIPTVAPYVLPALLPALRAEFPDVAPFIVEDQTERLLASLRAGEIEAAVLALPSGEPGLVELPLYTEEFLLVVPEGHDLDGRSDLPLSALATLPILLLDDGHCLRDQTIDLCRSVNAAHPAGDTRATSLATIVQCVAGGLGVTLIPRSAVSVETGKGALGIVEFAQPRPGRKMGLVHRSSSARADEYAAVAELIARVGGLVGV